MFMEYTHYNVDARLVKRYFEQSGETIEWLEDMGVEFEGAYRYFPKSEPTWHIVKTILKDALWDVKQIVLKKKQILIEICGKQYEEMPYKQFMEHFYHEEHGRYLQIQFVSPTAFKQRGNYVFFPDLHCLFQSLMNKYDAAAGDHIMLDEETLEQLCANAQIVRYDLKSVSFSLEGVRIPSFIGKITIRMNGTKTMAGFANMLIEFGTFSGVGIKTSLGMGYIRQIKERG